MNGGFSVDTALQRGLEHQLAGRRTEAESLYRQVLRVDSRNASALQLLGVLATEAGDAQRAVELLRQSVAADPAQPAAFSNLGNALMALHRHADAVACFDRAIALRPRYPIALLNRGIALIHLGEHGRAVESLDRALLEVPDNAAARFNRGVAWSGLGRLDDALRDYTDACRVAPDFLPAWLGRASVLSRLGRHLEAIDAYDAILGQDPAHPEALTGRGVALVEVGRFEAALHDFERVIHVDGATAGHLNNRGLALSHLRQPESAMACFDEALRLSPESVEALTNRGWLLLMLNRLADAQTSLEKAVSIDPQWVRAWTTLGAVFRALESPVQAFECFDRALSLDPQSLDALHNRGVILTQARRFPEAIESFRRLLNLDPEHPYALGNLFDAQLRCCDWTEYETHRATILNRLDAGGHPVRPFFFLAVADDPARQLACARGNAARNHAVPEPVRLVARAANADGRIRVGYVSGDLRDHAVSYLMAGLFEAHDRSLFEVLAVSLRPPVDTPMGRRIQAGFDRFVDVSRLDDAAIAARIRELEIDVAIDLSGYTGAARAGIFARRAAPLQVNYLGFPATMGAPFIDYLVADAFLVPPESRRHYAEKIITLPDCFQVNDRQREISGALSSRADHGLPDQGMVFASFSNSYKLTPALFRIWLTLLQASPGSVLWLLGGNPWVEANLRELAQRESVGPERLVFAGNIPYPEHLERLRHADLCLDTLPFNGGTTASDVLWAGVPLLTCAGHSFAARMAGSLLAAVGLPELIATSLEEYAALGLRLAVEPARLAALRKTLAKNRLTTPLFDTQRFCHALEAAFATIWDRHLRGEAPEDLTVRASH